MCEANAYFLRDNNEVLIMEAVDTAVPEEGGKIRLVNIFGEQKIVHGEIIALALVDHKIFIQEFVTEH